MNYLALFDVLRKGEAVADPATWKNRSTIVIAVSAFLMTLNHVYPLGIDQQTADALGGTVAFAVFLWNQYATSKTVGILPAKPVAGNDAAVDVRGAASKQEAP
jgi:hypothetical protein